MLQILSEPPFEKFTQKQSYSLVDLSKYSDVQTLSAFRSYPPSREHLDQTAW